MTDQEVLAALKAHRDGGAAPKSDADVLAALKAHRDGTPVPKAPEEPGVMDKLKDAFQKTSFSGSPLLAGGKYLANGGLEHIAKVLQYPGGVSRALQQYGPNDHLVTGKPSVGTLDDIKNALMGHAPTTDDYLKRAGYGEGPSIDLPIVGKITGRGTLGMMNDVATDPLMALGPGAVGESVEGRGAKLYKSGVKNLDAEGIKYGKEPVSDVLRKNKVWGSASSIQQQIDDLADKLLEQKRGIMKDATDKGATVDMQTAVNRAQDFVDEMRADGHPMMGNAIDELQAQIDKYKATGKRPADITGAGAQSGPTPTQVNSWTASNNGVIPDAAYKQLASSGKGYGFEKALNGGLRDANVEAVQHTIPGRVPELLETNDDLGRLLTSKDRALQDAAVAEKKAFFTPTKAAVTALKPNAGIWMALADAAKLPAVRTGGGLALEKAGQSAIPDALARRAYIDQYLDDGSKR